MKEQLLHTPEGVRDIYGSEFVRRFELQNALFDVMNSYGYQGIETPSFEFFDVFGKEVGTVPSSELYKFFDKEGNTLVLRPDITPSIARAVSKYFHGEEPIRLCYMGHTFINYEKYQGRLKESAQLGAELMGDGSVKADVEMISLVVAALQKAGLKEFQISLGQVRFFRSLLLEADLEESVQQALQEQISNKNVFAIEELLSDQPIPEHLKNVFTALTSLSGGVEVLEEAKKLTENEKALEAVAILEDIYEGLKGCGCEKYVSFDLGMLSKYDYYTGIIFRGYTFGSGKAIVKGGRYDKLLSYFGRKLPAVGFAIMIDELMSALIRKEEREENESRDQKRYLTFALGKGRLAKKTLELLEEIGIHMEQMKDPHTRKLIFVDEEQKLRFFLAKGQDVPTYVEYGAADIGVVGSDTILEECRKMYEVLDLGFGKCRMCVCGPASAKEKLESQELIRVATKYPNIAKDYFYNKKHQTAEIIKLNGSVELAPIVGLSEVIVDIVETGATLRENGLEILEEVKDLSAKMVVNRVSMEMERERISDLICRIKTVVQEKRNAYENIDVK